MTRNFWKERAYFSIFQYLTITPTPSSLMAPHRKIKYDLNILKYPIGVNFHK